jgi:hypothetical protein
MGCCFLVEKEGVRNFARKIRQPSLNTIVIYMVAQFFQDCVGFKIFLAGLKKRGST